MQVLLNIDVGIVYFWYYWYFLLAQIIGSNNQKRIKYRRFIIIFFLEQSECNYHLFENFPTYSFLDKQALSK